MTTKGTLLAIEGIDGTGKTTLQHALARHWRALGLSVIEFREPSRSPWGIRARRTSGKDPWTAALAFTDDRRHQKGRLERALNEGAVVLLDRSFYSTLAYQGSALSLARRRELERMQIDATVAPDRVVLLDLPLAASKARVDQRGRAREPTEHEAILRRASRAYRKMAHRPRWLILDSRRSPEELVEQVDRRWTPWLLRRHTPHRARA